MSEGLAQGPYVAAKVGFEIATIRTQGTELTTEPPRGPRPKNLSTLSSVSTLCFELRPLDIELLNAHRRRIIHSPLQFHES